MITQITGVPPNMVAFSATGKVTKEDFDEVVVPAVDALTQTYDQLNYLMSVDTELSNFEAGAWLKDICLGFQKLTKWNRVAILTDSEGANTFTNIFSLLAPGEYKGYRRNQLREAIAWVSGNQFSEVKI